MTGVRGGAMPRLIVTDASHRRPELSTMISKTSVRAVVDLSNCYIATLLARLVVGQAAAIAGSLANVTLIRR